VLGDYLSEGEVARHDTECIARDLLKLVAETPDHDALPQP
jgi:hypothetical protein